jgi:hypothetical protein
VLNAYTGALRRYAVIVKHKIYNEAFTTARNSGRGITFEFINKTIIDNSGTNKLRFLIDSDKIINVHAINYQSGAGFLGSNSMICYAENCYFENISPFHYANGLTFFFNNCVFVNCYIGSIVSSTNYNRCVFVNCRNNASYPANAKNSVFYNSNGFGFNSSSVIDYCLQYGLLNGKTIEENQALGFNLNGLQSNPQFNDPLNKIFTVRGSSPCLYRGENGEHIGVGEGFWLSANEIFNNLELNDNFQVQSGKLLRIDDNSDGLLETYILNLGGVKSVEKIDVASNLGFLFNELKKSLVIYSEGYITYDSSSTYHEGASVTDSAIKYRSLVNDNVGNTPATSPTDWERMTWESGVSYAAGKIVQYTDDKWYKANTATSTSWVAGEWDEIVISDYLTFQMKFGRTFSEANNADWTNLPFNILLQVDVSGKGSMDDDFDTSTSASIRFNYYKLRIHVKTIR